MGNLTGTAGVRRAKVAITLRGVVATFLRPCWVSLNWVSLILGHLQLSAGGITSLWTERGFERVIK